MRELLTVNDLSYEASIRVALETAGIDVVFDRPFAARAPAVSRCLVNDADYERAAALVATLQQTPPTLATDRRFNQARVGAIVILVGILLAALWRGLHA